MANTVICLASDHGEHNGDFGLLHKMSFLDPSVRIPLVVRTPETAKAGGTGGAVVSSPAELMDVGPTLVEVAGGQLRHEQFGRSVMPVRSDSSTSLSYGAA